MFIGENGGPKHNVLHLGQEIAFFKITQRGGCDSLANRDIHWREVHVDDLNVNQPVAVLLVSHLLRLALRDHELGALGAVIGRIGQQAFEHGPDVPPAIRVRLAARGNQSAAHEGMTDAGQIGQAVARKCDWFRQVEYKLRLIIRICKQICALVNRPLLAGAEKLTLRVGRQVGTLPKSYRRKDP